jgi:hypothetical protein
LLAPPTQNEGATFAQQYPGPKAPQPLFSVSPTPSASPVATQSPPASGPRRSKALFPKSFFSKFKTDAAAAEPDLLSKIWPSNYPPGVRSIYSNPQRATAQPARKPEMSSTAAVTEPVKAPTAAVETAQAPKSKEAAADPPTHPAKQAETPPAEPKDAVATPAPSTQGEIADWKPSKRRLKTAKASQAKAVPVATSSIQEPGESVAEAPSPQSVVGESVPPAEESTISIEKAGTPERAVIVALGEKHPAVAKTPATEDEPAESEAKAPRKPAKQWTKPRSVAPAKQLSHREPDRVDSQPEIVEINLGAQSVNTSGSIKRRPIIIQRANDDEASVTRPSGGSFRRGNAEFDSVQANVMIPRDTDDRELYQAPSSSKSINPLRPAGPPIPSASWESERKNPIR